MNSTPITETVVLSFDILSAPFTAGPPNGCVPRETVREMTHIEIYRANYYGIDKEYVRGHKRWTDADGSNAGPAFGGFSDGNLEAIECWRARYAERVTDEQRAEWRRAAHARTAAVLRRA